MTSVIEKHDLLSTAFTHRCYLHERKRHAVQCGTGNRVGRRISGEASVTPDCFIGTNLQSMKTRKNDCQTIWSGCFFPFLHPRLNQELSPAPKTFPCNDRATKPLSGSDFGRQPLSGCDNTLTFRTRPFRAFRFKFRHCRLPTQSCP